MTAREEIVGAKQHCGTGKEKSVDDQSQLDKEEESLFDHILYSVQQSETRIIQLGLPTP